MTPAEPPYIYYVNTATFLCVCMWVEAPNFKQQRMPTINNSETQQVITAK